MTALWLGHFVRQMAFHYGLGGWVLLVLIAGAIGLIAMGVLLLACKIVAGALSFARDCGRSFADGWRKGPTPQREDVP